MRENLDAVLARSFLSAGFQGRLRALVAQRKLCFQRLAL
jgi:hypothetical protein